MPKINYKHGSVLYPQAWPVPQLVTLSYYGRYSIEVQIHCFARSIHRCILASYGGIFLYKACIN